MWNKSVLLVCVVFCFSLSVEAKVQLLSKKVAQLEQQLSGQVGVAILDVYTQEVTGVNHRLYFPMMSTFKPLACAKVLSEVDKQHLTLDTALTVEQADLVVYSPIIKNFVGKVVTLEQACEASITWSDNTAANIILQHIGGPAGLTQFMRSLGDKNTRLDRFEPELNQELAGDKRDSTTPQAMVATLYQLFFNQTLSPQATKRLQNWMLNSKTSTKLLRSILPLGWSIADKTGFGENGSRGFTAIIWPPGQSPKVIALYLTQTQGTLEQLNQAIVELGQIIISELQQQEKQVL